MFSIVIPSLGLKRQINKRYFYKKRYDLIDCLTSLKNHYDFNDIQVSVIFNSCKRSEIEHVLDKFPNINYSINKQNIGVPRSWNMGANISSNDNICFLNDDCIVDSDILNSYSNYLNENKNVGIIGCAGSFWKNLEHSKYYDSDKIGSADIVSGFCFMTRHETLSKSGYFDFRYTPAGYDEIDFCMSVKELGLKCLIWPTNDIKHNIVHGVSGAKQDIHFFDQSISTDNLNIRNKTIFTKKWKKRNY